MKFHAYIARGSNAASTMIEAETKESAAKKAASLWDETVANINVHLKKDCGQMGCGDSYDKRRFP